MGIRPSITLYDHGRTATRNASPGNFDFARIFTPGRRVSRNGGVIQVPWV
jgi:hypothetical protein